MVRREIFGPNEVQEILESVIHRRFEVEILPSRVLYNTQLSSLRRYDWEEGEPGIKTRQLSYPRSHLLPPSLVLRVIRLAEDIIPPILDPRSSVVPVGAFVARLVVHLHPHFGRRRDQYSRRDTGDRSWLQSRLLAVGGAAS